MGQYSLVGIDGNAFAILGYVRQCMVDEKESQESIDEYLIEAKSSDYSHLISVSLDVIFKLNGIRNDKKSNEINTDECIWCGDSYDEDDLNVASDTNKKYCESCSCSLFQCDSCGDCIEEDFSEDDEQVLCESCERSRKLEEE